MKGKKFLAFVMVCVLVSFAVSAEAFSIPKVSKGTKKSIGNALNKALDKGSEYLNKREDTKQAKYESQKKPDTTIINNTTNNNVNINQTQTINQTQINQTQNIGTNDGSTTGSARMRVGGGSAGISRSSQSPTSRVPQGYDDDDYYGDTPVQNRRAAAPQNSTSSNPAAELRVSMKNMGSRIIANNAPSYEIQLAQSELPARVKTRFNKVCTTNQTVVVGDAGSNKKYGAFCMITSDPSITFAGGIRVGASVSTVENFFGKSISHLSSQPGRAHISAGNSLEIDILYSGNRITQIGYYDSNSLSCQRTGNFFTRKVNEMGLRNMY